MKQEKTGLMRPGLCIVFMIIFIAGPVFGDDQGPDQMYHQGRYAEAQKEYSRLDMDNPKDVRFRYNKGCAAYQAGDYDAAGSAFSSVLRRTQSKGLEFRSLYNLGNTAFRKGDYSSAAGYYRDAIVRNPQNSDARYNLELTLAAEKKQKQGDASQQSPDSKSEGGEKHKDSQDSTSGDTENTSPPKDAQENARQQDKKNSGNNTSSNRDTDKAENPEDLSGKLNGPQASAGSVKPGQDHSAEASMNKQRAEALLDNTVEDRSLLYRHAMSGDGNALPASGKDW